MEQAGLFVIGDFEGGLAIWFSIGDVREGEPLEPKILYDGGDHAILYRSPTEPIALEMIPKEWCAKLLKAPEVRVAEGQPENSLEYVARVEKVLKIPAVEGKIKILKAS
ncbi:MAG: hypothetical protein FWD15_00605 [Alphaproteobacteria bacterium]|nr:hypothetical protein [Alphaproteobacteria bacterium]